MKRITALRTVLPFLALAVVALVAQPTVAQAQSAKVAVIDFQRIQRESKASISANQQWQEYLKTFQSSVQDEQQKAMDQERELTAQRNLLSPEAYAQKRADFKKRLGAFNQKVQMRRRNIDIVFSQALKSIQDKAQSITKEVAQSKGVDVVLLKASVFMLVDEGLDLTDTVLARLVKELPTVKLADPATGEMPSGSGGQ